MLYNRYKNRIKISGDFDCVGAFQKDLIVFENTANGGGINTNGKLVIDCKA